MKKIYAFIFARGGSKGVPKKNIRLLNGKPLLAYSIEITKKIKEISKVFVSTDDPEIANIARDYNANVINRPAELSQDNSPEYLAWQHAIRYLHNKKDYFDTFLSLPTTAPLRNISDIKNSINALTNNIDFVITMTTTNHTPYFNMVQKKDSYVELILKTEKNITRRQDVSNLYNITTVAYVGHPKSILKKKSIFNGRVRGIEVPNERAIDIDTELDFSIAEYLMKKRTKNDTE